MGNLFLLLKIIDPVNLFTVFPVFILLFVVSSNVCFVCMAIDIPCVVIMPPVCD